LWRHEATDVTGNGGATRAKPHPQSSSLDGFALFAMTLTGRNCAMKLIVIEQHFLTGARRRRAFLS